MVEQKVIILSKSEIAEILAKYFGVDISNCEIIADEGDPQYPKMNVYARIKKYDLSQRFADKSSKLNT